MKTLSLRFCCKFKCSAYFQNPEISLKIASRLYFQLKRRRRKEERDCPSTVSPV